MHTPDESRPALSPPAAAMLAALESGLAGPDRSTRLARFAAVLARKGLRGDAARICVHVLTRFAGDDEAVLIARTVLAEGIPAWHLEILRDDARVAAYAARLEQAVRPGMLVLDIGTGSGLLAMLAARAGAGLVIACEQDPALAVMAEENVRRNGYADRVRVIAKPSSRLVVGDDLPRRADLAVSEIVDSSLLGEGILQSVADARHRLLMPGAIAIPESGAIHVAAAIGATEGPAFDDVTGLDLSLMDHLRAIGFPARRPDIELVTRPETLFTFDLSGRPLPSHGSAAVTLVATRPCADARILRWMSLDLGAGVTLDAGPESRSRSWRLIEIRTSKPLGLRAGDRIGVRGEYSGSNLSVWAVPPH